MNRFSVFFFITSTVLNLRLGNDNSYRFPEVACPKHKGITTTALKKMKN